MPTDSEKRKHYILRHQFIDEITFDHGSKTGPRLGPRLTAFEKNVGRMIAKSVNAKTGETFESFSSFAKRLGGKVKVRHVENAAKVLEARDWLKIEPRGSRVYLSFKVKGLHGHRSTKLPDHVFKVRELQIEAALECKELMSQSVRFAYIGLLSISDKDHEWRDGQRDAALRLGMPQRTFNLAMQDLQRLGLVRIDDQVLMPLPIITVEDDANLDSESISDCYGDVTEQQVSNSRATTEQAWSNVESDYPEISTGSKATLLTPVTPETPVTPVPYPTDTALVAARHGQRQGPSADLKAGKVRMSFTRDDWDRFHQLCDLIVDHSSGDRSHKTVGGIISVSRGDWAGNEVGADIYGYAYDGPEIQRFVDAGLFTRKGQQIHLNDTGRYFYDLYEQHQQRHAA